MLYAFTERQVRDPENWPELIAEYSTLIDGVPHFTLEQAYDLAKFHQVSLKRTVKSNGYELTENDLIGIAQYNPVVDWHEYLELKNHDLEYFLELHPELKILDIVWEDAFYYAMGAHTPFIEMNLKLLNRKKLFDQSSEIALPLLIELYGSEENYLYANPISFLEEYIFAYDLYITDANSIIGLAERLGIMLDPRNRQETIQDQMYSQLEGISEIVRNQKTFYILEDTYSVEDIVNLTYDQFDQLFKELKLPHDLTSYRNRLIIFLTRR